MKTYFVILLCPFLSPFCTFFLVFFFFCWESAPSLHFSWRLIWFLLLYECVVAAYVCVCPTGTKCIDPNTGLVYFKYDFGYEFGILFPGEGHKFMSQKWQKSPTKTNLKAMSFGGKQSQSHPLSGDRDLIIPVQHEHTANTPILKSAMSSGLKRNSSRNTKVVSIDMDALHSNDTQNTSLPHQYTGGSVNMEWSCNMEWWLLHHSHRSRFKVIHSPAVLICIQIHSISLEIWIQFLLNSIQFNSIHINSLFNSQ